MLDAGRGERFSDSLDAATRRSLDGVFRELRANGGIDATTRARLIDAVAAWIERPS